MPTKLLSMNDLLQDVESFLTKHGLQPTTLGKTAMNDPNFVFDLRAGRDVLRSTEQRIRNFMSEYTSK